MDDNFRLRAAKAFGSLPTSRSSSLHAQPPAWSVASGEVERREWRRGKDADADASDRDQIPCSSSFLEDEWGIKASIGKDPTLDFEDEEDEYDKVAAGTDGIGDRLFMNEVDNHASYLNSHNVLHCTDKDPPAVFLAERRKLKEDKAPALASQVKEQLEKSTGDGGQLKSILKRKDSTLAMKERKRVRFDPSFITNCDSEEPSEKDEDFVMTSSNVNGIVSDDGSVSTPKQRTASSVPDYLVNPSKYTRYNFDSTSEIDEAGNTRACMDYLSQVKDSNTESRSEMEDASAHLPKSVTFVPRKKAGDITMKEYKEDDNKQSLNRAGVTVGIAAMEVQGEVSAEEEEGSEPNAADSCLKKAGRKYRSKPMSDEPDSLMFS